MRRILFLVAYLSAQALHAATYSVPMDSSGNLKASLVVPTGVSVAPSGSGSISATSVPWSGITSKPTTFDAAGFTGGTLTGNATLNNTELRFANPTLPSGQRNWKIYPENYGSTGLLSFYASPDDFANTVNPIFVIGRDSAIYGNEGYGTQNGVHFRGGTDGQALTFTSYGVEFGLFQDASPFDATTGYSFGPSDTSDFFIGPKGEPMIGLMHTYTSYIELYNDLYCHASGTFDSWLTVGGSFQCDAGGITTDGTGALTVVDLTANAAMFNAFIEVNGTASVSGALYLGSSTLAADAGGNVTISPGTISIPVGTAAGTVTLSSGAGTITSSRITTTSVIHLSLKTNSGTPGTFEPRVDVHAGSATVTGAAGDNSTYNWVLILTH